MLDTAGKLFEKLLKSRLQITIKKAVDLFDRQFRFRKGLRTVYATQKIIDAASQTKKNHFFRLTVLLVTLDVKMPLIRYDGKILYKH